MNAVTTGDADAEMHIDEEGRPKFAPAKNTVWSFLIGIWYISWISAIYHKLFLIAISNDILQDGLARVEVRKVPVPPHRMTPLKATWPKIYPPLVEHLKLQVRMNVKSKAVELRTSKHTTDTGALQKGADFVQAFCLGFDVEDSIALLRLDDLYIETFES